MNRSRYIPFLKALADENRLSIVQELENGEKMVGDIQDALGISQSSTSQQLKKLVQADVLKSRRDGTRKYFSIKNPRIFDILTALESYMSVSSTSGIFNLEKEDKVLFTGLSGSGKTSILLNIFGYKNVGIRVRATKGFRPFSEILEDYALDKDPSIKTRFYEAGGKKEYRNEYIKKPAEYGFTEFDKLVFCIDVQNQESYNNALFYLGDLMDIYRDDAGEHEFTIFLHKSDPDYLKMGEISEGDINERLVNKIKPLVPPKYAYSVYKTSLTSILIKKMVMKSVRI